MYEIPSTPMSTPVAIAAPFTSVLLPVSGNELADTDVLDGVVFALLGQVALEPQLLFELLLGQVVLEPQFELFVLQFGLFVVLLVPFVAFTQTFVLF
jgi:hypothetical protein